MKIAFDAQLIGEVQKTGIGHVTVNLIKEFVKHGENEYIANYFSLGAKSYTKAEIEKLSEIGIGLNECRWFNNTLYRMMWPFIPVPYSLFFGRKTDLSCFFNYYVPPFCGGKRITFVHDMVCMDCPETMSFKTKIMLSLTLKKSVKRADRIITISEFSKSRIIHHLGVEPEKITVIPLGKDEGRYNNNYDEQQIRAVCDKFKIDGKYFLYLGTIEPRKNIEGILDGYYAFLKKAENDSDINKTDFPYLVIAGKKGWLFESVFEKAEKLGLSDKVIFTGYVSDFEAPVLMAGAEAFVFPSFYEGFGMPPLEAMACGTPVITSNCASLPEVVGDAGILVNPQNYSETAEAMYNIFYDADLAKRLSEKSIERAKLFTWKKSAQIFLEACTETLKG